MDSSGRSCSCSAESTRISGSDSPSLLSPCRECPGNLPASSSCPSRGSTCGQVLRSDMEGHTSQHHPCRCGCSACPCSKGPCPWTDGEADVTGTCPLWSRSPPLNRFLACYTTAGHFCDSTLRPAREAPCPSTASSSNDPQRASQASFYVHCRTC